MPQAKIDALSVLDRPIAFHRVFVTISGSVNAALFLSQAMYWTRRTDHDDGWFFKTREEWEEETGLSRYEQESARKRLRTLKILEEQQRGINRTTWFRVDQTALMQRLESSRSNGGNPADGTGEIPPLLIGTETTTETTSERERPTGEKSPKRGRSETTAPDVYELTPAHYEKAAEYGVGADRLLLETDNFLDHHRAKGSRFKDWDAAWRTWMRNVPSYSPRTSQPSWYEQRPGETSLQRSIRTSII